MKNIKLLLKIFLFGMFLIFFPSKADDLSDITQVVQRFYSVNERMLQCRTKDEDEFDEKLIYIPQGLFSKDLFSFYSVICVRNDSNISTWFDIRTGDPGIHVTRDWRDSISNIRIGKPILSSKGNIVRVTYDLEGASFKQWGNFTDLKFVKEEGRWRIDDIEIGGSGVDRNSYTALVELKSLKKYLKDEIAKWKKLKK